MGNADTYQNGNCKRKNAPVTRPLFEDQAHNQPVLALDTWFGLLWRRGWLVSGKAGITTPTTRGMFKFAVDRGARDAMPVGPGWTRSGRWRPQGQARRERDGGWWPGQCHPALGTRPAAMRMEEEENTGGSIGAEKKSQSAGSTPARDTRDNVFFGEHYMRVKYSLFQWPQSCIERSSRPTCRRSAKSGDIRPPFIMPSQDVSFIQKKCEGRRTYVQRQIIWRRMCVLSSGS